MMSCKVILFCAFYLVYYIFFTIESMIFLDKSSRLWHLYTYVCVCAHICLGVCLYVHCGKNARGAYLLTIHSIEELALNKRGLNNTHLKVHTLHSLQICHRFVTLTCTLLFVFMKIKIYILLSSVKSMLG